MMPAAGRRMAPAPHLDGPLSARPWPSVESRRCPRPRDQYGRRPLCVRGHRDSSTHS